MKKILISALLALVLVAVMVAPAMGAEQTQTVPASVTVTTVISATITDNGDTGLLFGEMSKGSSNQAEAAQGASNGAVTIVVAAETSVNCNIQLKAMDFTGTGGTLPITNAKYNTTNTVGTAFAAADTYYTLDTYTVGDGLTTVEAYHWLSIPSNQVAGSYSSTFTYRVGE